MYLIKNVLLNDSTCDILIKGNTIAKIATEIHAPEATTIDATGKAILPSFANMHTHAAMMFLRGLGEDKELFAWLSEDIWPREAKLKHEHIYPLSRFAILEMIKSGTTLFNDMYGVYGDCTGTVQAASEMGIRGAISFVGFDLFDEKETNRRKEKISTFMAEPVNSEYIIKGLSCHAIYTTSQELITFAHDLAKKYNTFFHIHVSETEKEVQDCIQKTGLRPVELLHSWGVLDSHSILAHSVHINVAEMDLIAKAGATIAHCPNSNFKLNSGQLPLQACLDKGIHVTLGTDSVSSNNALSMFSEMKSAALSGKSMAHSPQAAKVQDVYDIATRNGFETLGLNAGEIAEGKLADFILVDLDNPFLLPNSNMISNMVYAADTSCITDVFCNGKPVMQNKVVPHEQEIIAEFKKVCAELI